MKLSLKQLKQIIEEQVSSSLNEERNWADNLHRDWRDEMAQIGAQVAKAVENALRGAMSEYNIVLTEGEIYAVAGIAAKHARQVVKTKLVPPTHMDM